MRIHHLSCGTMCPVGGRLIHGSGRNRHMHRFVCHCLLIETPRHGLVLIDTGLGLQDVLAPRARLSRLSRLIKGVRLRERETAVRQVEALGFSPADVRHIVLTHLDFNHAGGIEDFPEATVHVLGPEFDAAQHERRGFVARGRYRPQQWKGIVKWRIYEATGEPWLGFPTVRQLRGLPPEILMVPLPGHTWGHSGIAIERPDGWLFHVGDAYFHAAEMDLETPYSPLGLRAYQHLMDVDHEARLTNQQRLRDLMRTHGDDIDLFCAHDVTEFLRLRWMNRMPRVREQAMPQVREKIRRRG